MEKDQAGQKVTPVQRKVIALALSTAIALPMEGVRQVWYYDPPGIPTVCMGHTGADIDKNKVYSLAECKALMNKDMLNAINTVEKCVPGLAAEPLAAFSDGVYNLGPALVCDPRKSTAARMLKAGDIKGACNQLPRWSKANIAGVMVTLPGLVKRRNMEMELCLKEGQS